MLKSSKKRRNLQPETTESVQSLIERIQKLEKEKETLRLKRWNQRRGPFGMIAYVLLIFGLAALMVSMLQALTILAFIGLTLTFWGALFLYVRPGKYVKPSLLHSTAISSLKALDRVVSNLNYEGKAVYLPPLPYILKGYKSGAVYISSRMDQILPAVEELAEEETLIKDRKGICLVPPGVGLTNLYEEELGKEFLQVDFEYLRDNLPRILVQDLEIATDVEMHREKNDIHVKIAGSIFRDFCRQFKTLGNICNSFGCPLCSSIACALTRTLGKPIIIEKAGLAPDRNTIEAHFRTMEE